MYIGWAISDHLIKSADFYQCGNMYLFANIQNTVADNVNIL